MISTVHLAIFTIILGLVLILRTFTNKGTNPSPGPKGKFLIGNLFDLPSSGAQEWLHWLKHKDLYGTLLSSSVLEKNSIKHSSQPHLVFAGELAAWGKLVPSQDNTPLLRAYRRAITRVIGARESAAKFNGLIELEARRFACRILHTPEKFLDHNRTASGAFILTITYGYNIDGGAGDTTTAILEGFFLAMMLFPDVQRKAQAEMDELFGKPALPSTTDRERLPYVNAIVKEATRWLTVVPLGIPHRTDQDDIINGYLIPKNTIIVPNTWSFNNDPTIYPNPRDFEPERFLSKPGALEPGDVSFGFGRRVCPGRLIGETSIFLIIAHILAIFDIRKPAENGEEIKSTLDSTAGLLIHLVPFNASITPRSREHEQLMLISRKRILLKPATRRSWQMSIIN
ncbi:unnamed protein product [Penicillium palitans]